MPVVLRAIVFTVALTLFAVETFRTKSLLAAGLAGFSLPFAWDAWVAT